MSQGIGLTYTPEDPPHTMEPEDLVNWVFAELREIAGVMEGATLLQLRELNAEPDKLEEGMIALADGTNWNPGGTGAGFYGYRGGSWVKLG